MTTQDQTAKAINALENVLRRAGDGNPIDTVEIMGAITALREQTGAERWIKVDPANPRTDCYFAWLDDKSDNLEPIVCVWPPMQKYQKCFERGYYFPLPDLDQKAALQNSRVSDGEGTYAGWKAKSRAHAIARMLDFHGDKPSERIVEIGQIMNAERVKE